MKGISGLFNFKENFSKNTPYYQLISRQICAQGQESRQNASCILEHAVLSAESGGSIVSKVCEGYQFSITFSGELFFCDIQKEELSGFGYHFLSDNHAELALFSYIHFGEKCAEKLCGNFSLIIYDSMRRNIFALTKGNSLPVFYTKFRDFYILSSSLRGIFAFPDMPKRLNSESVSELISAQNRIPHQIFEGIFMLPSDKILKISQKGIKELDSLHSSSVLHKEDCTYPFRFGAVLSGSPLDKVFLTQGNLSKAVTLYAEKFPDRLHSSPFKKQHLLIDEGTVLQALETTVAACGFPFLSGFDFLLPIALRQAKGTNEPLYFSMPDRFSSYKNYTSTLLANGVFHNPIENNIHSFCPKSCIFPEYTSLISDFLSADTKVPYFKDVPFNADICPASQKLKTVLRRILLGIISKENSPILAFFRRSSLLRLCEGGFSFSESQSEIELTSYLIKLNLWFEIFAPSII